MANFESPISKKQVVNQPMREFTVTDESEYPEIPQVEVPNYQFQPRTQQSNPYAQQPNFAPSDQEIRRMKEEKRTGKERLSEGAKKRIEMLIGITRSVREVDVNGTQFVFQSLKSKEIRECFTNMTEFDGTIQGPFEIRRQFLARSIVKIAGIDVEEFIGSNAIEAKLNFIDELDESLLSRLYSEYLILNDEAKQKFSLRTEADAKEVAEDLKK